MVDGFRRKPVVLGLSNVEVEDPDISDGVLIIGGGTSELPCWDDSVAETSALEGSVDGVTDALLYIAGALRADVTGAAAFSVLFVPCSLFSEGVMLLLARFAKRETCCTALLCFPSTLLLSWFVEMRLDCLR